MGAFDTPDQLPIAGDEFDPPMICPYLTLFSSNNFQKCAYAIPSPDSPVALTIKNDIMQALDGQSNIDRLDNILLVTWTNVFPEDNVSVIDVSPIILDALIG